MDLRRIALFTAVVLALIGVHWIFGQIKGLTTVANNRFTKLTQIDKSNVARLGPKWLFPSKKHGKWQAGREYMGGTARPASGETFETPLRAIDIQAGKIVWEVPQASGRATASAGVLSTESGLVFFGENSGSFMAVDATKVQSCGSFPRRAFGRHRP